MDRLDILNRDKFVAELLQIVKNISDNKSSTCFALNGDWGSGKSFVLDMFEEKLVQISILLFAIIVGNTIITKNRLWRLCQP